MKKIIGCFFLLILINSFAQKSWVDSLLSNGCHKTMCDEKGVFSRKEKREISKIMSKDSIQGNIQIITTEINNFPDFTINNQTTPSYYSQNKGVLLILYDKGTNEIQIYNFLKNKSLINYKEEWYLSQKSRRNDFISVLNEIVHLLKNENNTVYNTEEFNSFVYYNFDYGDFYYNTSFDITLNNVEIPVNQLSKHLPHLIYIKNNQKLTTAKTLKLKGDTTYYYIIDFTLSKFKLSSRLSITHISDENKDFRIYVSPKNHDYFPQQKINTLLSILTKERNKYLLNNFEMQYDIDSLLQKCDRVDIINQNYYEDNKQKSLTFYFNNDTINTNGVDTISIKKPLLNTFLENLGKELKLRTNYTTDCFIPTYEFIFSNKNNIIGTLELVLGDCPGYGYKFFQKGYTVRDSGAFINDISHLEESIKKLFQQK